MQSYSPTDFSLKAVIQRFEDRYAILRNDSAGEFRWPLDNLPGDIQIGSTVVLKMTNLKSEEDEKLSRMRKLLEELIN